MTRIQMNRYSQRQLTISIIAYFNTNCKMLMQERAVEILKAALSYEMLHSFWVMQSIHCY